MHRTKTPQDRQNSRLIDKLLVGCVAVAILAFPAMYLAARSSTAPKMNGAIFGIHQKGCVVYSISLKPDATVKEVTLKIRFPRQVDATRAGTLTTASGATPAGYVAAPVGILPNGTFSIGEIAGLSTDGVEAKFTDNSLVIVLSKLAQGAKFVAIVATNDSKPPSNPTNAQFTEDSWVEYSSWGMSVKRKFSLANAGIR